MLRSHRVFICCYLLCFRPSRPSSLPRTNLEQADLNEPLASNMSLFQAVQSLFQAARSLFQAAQSTSQPAQPTFQEAATQPTDYKFKGIEEVHVGPSNDVFYFHPAIVCTRSRSQVLTKAMLPPWKQLGRPIAFPHDDPEVFEGYLRCVYWGPEKAAQMNGDSEGELGFLFQVWQFADYLQDRETANSIVDEIIRRHQKYDSFPTPDDIRFAYDNTPRGSELQKVTSELIAYDLEPELRLEMGKLNPGLPVEFHQDVVALCAENDGLVIWETLRKVLAADWCHYHQHNETTYPKCKRVLSVEDMLQAEWDAYHAEDDDYYSFLE